MDEINTAMQSVKMALSMFSDAVRLTKDAKELLPESDEKNAIEESLKEAESAAKLAEAQVAQALGYKLCQCTFPPQIMLSNGYKEGKENFVCAGCNKSSIPPTQNFTIPNAHNAFKGS